MGVPISPASILRLGFHELRLETPHETDLEHDAGLVCRGGHGVALFQGQRHWLLTENVLARACGEQRKLGVHEGGSGDHDPFERRCGERLLEVGEDRYAKFGSRPVPNLRIGVDDAGKLGGGDRPGGVACVHHPDTPGAEHGQAERVSHL